MGNLQLIRHNLIQMFAMRQADILMKHQTVNDSQNTVYTVNGQKDYPAEIFCFNDKPAYQEKRRIKAILTEPTSPAKHLARLRKLKKQKTRTEQITV